MVHLYMTGNRCDAGACLSGGKRKGEVRGVRRMALSACSGSRVVIWRAAAKECAGFGSGRQRTEKKESDRVRPHRAAKAVCGVTNS